MIDPKQKEFEHLFAFTIGALLLIYAFYFLILPQSWTLNNNYGQVRGALEASYSAWDAAVASFKYRLYNEGRFLLIDSFLTPLKLKYLPLTPLTMRVGQFLYLVIALTALVAFLKRFKVSRLQILFAVMLALANLSMKEWIVLDAALEGLASAFFLAALAFYIWGKKYWGVIFFILSFCSKESFVFLAGTFALIEYFEFKKKKKINYLPLVVLGAISLVFIAYISQLPRTYTAGHFNHIPYKNIIIGLILPPIKCFGLAIIFVGYNYWKTDSKKLSAPTKEIALIGASIIIPMSVFLSLWGPFDSWWYLHLVIPFGWVFVLSAFLEKTNLKNKVVVALGYSVIVFSLLFTIRGSLSRWQGLAEAKTVADIACEDSQRVSGLKVFSNCEEAASQLQNYLAIYNKTCPNPPKIEYLSAGLPSDLKPPYEIIFGRKWCNTNGDEFKNITTTYRLDLSVWSVYKNLQK